MSVLHLNLQMQMVFEQREKKRTKVYRFFEQNIEQRFSSSYLHSEFGSSVRTRISEVNRDQTSEIRIVNETKPDEQGKEHSVYYAVRRAQ